MSEEDRNNIYEYIKELMINYQIDISEETINPIISNSNSPEEALNKFKKIIEEMYNKKDGTQNSNNKNKTLSKLNPSIPSGYHSVADGNVNEYNFLGNRNGTVSIIFIIILTIISIAFGTCIGCLVYKLFFK